MPGLIFKCEVSVLKTYVFIIIFVIIVAVICGFSFLSRKFANPYKLYLLFGKKGSGKTTLLVRQMLWHLNHGWLVYTDIDEVTIPGVRHINNPVDLGKFSPPANTAFFIDEINLLWDNRDYKSFRKDTQKWFRLQRHYRVKCYLASQTYDADKKIRDQTDAMYLCTCVGNVFSVARAIVKKPVITASDSMSESRISEDLKMLPFWNWKITFIPRYRKFFDSHAVEPLPEFRFRRDELPNNYRKEFRQLRGAWKAMDRRNAALRKNIKGNIKQSRTARAASGFASYRDKEQNAILPS